jgi:2-amino-4-hydroxy-6-hydroxymethyldihydropteridine diphosphokinase
VIADLGLGSNLSSAHGDRLANLQFAVDALRAAGCRVDAVSAVYETDPVGGPDQDPFLNACVRVATDASPHELLRTCLAIEDAAGRVRRERWGPRTLDVDVLRCGDVAVDDAELTVPHPRMAERAFVLVPLADIDPSAPPAADTAGVRRTGLRIT